jgi:predicted NBD/HSP70 family sugar kinase
VATTNLSSRDLRRTNRATILRTLYFGGEMSRVNLSQQTHLSTATVTNVVAELLNEGSVIEVGSEESLGGRPRTILAINPRYCYLVGVDVGEQHLGLELFDLTLAKVATAEYPIFTHLAHPERIAERIAQGIETMLSTAGVSQQANVLGIGVGVPGVIQMTTEPVVHAPSIGWKAVPFHHLLEEQVPYRIFLDNGVKAMTQAELLIGAGRGYQHFVVVLMGTGVGAGIVVNGALYRGASNSAGEWGHSRLSLDGPLCRCGNRGCLEAYIGSSRILDRLRTQVPTHPALEYANEEEAMSSLAASARAGDPGAVQVLEETTHYLGVGIANLINFFNPQRLILGGWVGCQLGHLILPALRGIIETMSLPSSAQAVSLEVSQFGQDAVALGSATLVLERFLSSGGTKQELVG